MENGAIRAFAFYLWFSSAIFPYLFMSDWYAASALEADSSFIRYQIACLGLFTATQFLLAPKAFLRNDFIFIRSNGFALLSAFFVFAAVVSGHSISSFKSFVYAIGTFVALISCNIAWYNNGRWVAIALRFLPWFLLVFVGALIFIHGISGRAIGGIAPNHIGKIALVAAAPSILLTKNQRLFVLAASFSVMLLVSSRSAVFAGLILVFMTELFLRGPSRAFRIGFYLLVALAAVELITAVLTDTSGLIAKVITLVFKLSDPERGVGSGVSGRATFWANGILLFLKSPLIGLGFRTRESASLLLGNAANAHEGYLNILIDTGLIGFLLLMSGILGILLLRIRTIGKLRRRASRQPRNAELAITFRLNIIIASFVIANLALWTIEPDTINLALSSSIVFMLLIAAPPKIAVTHLRRFPEGASTEGIPI